MTLFEFLSPYVRFFHGAAYNLHQTLDGLGISSSGFIEQAADGGLVGGFAPGEAVVPVLVAIMFLALCSLPLVLLAGYILGRAKGIMIIGLLLLLPGLLNTLGFLPAFSLTPSRYSVGGTGSLGSAFGFASIILYAVLIGWSATIIIYDAFKLNDRFRHYYDHIWFLMAILAGVFFVADSGASEDAQELTDASAATRNASLYLLAQVREYDNYCQQNGLSESVSCRWASRVQQQLNEYASDHHKIYKEFGPHVSRTLYAPSWSQITDKEIIKIRQEINDYNNQRCPTTKLGVGSYQLSPASGICQTVPASYCTAFPDPPENLVDKYIIGRTVALASECIVPTLVRLRYEQEKTITVVSQNQRSKHYRWLFFIVFSIIVGGKIANSTTRVIDIDRRAPEEQQRIRELVYKVLKKTGSMSGLVARFLIWSYRFLKNQHKTS
ncbi:hypothetical protein [Pseudomonas lijiangensis]|uniref:Uncharacterized protein n=1 Tax=Pseudomonas lijiangensis TaxID=2995658 RepID=A0ABX8HKJ0_9PSED|nr:MULTISPECIES: hypothetical protein [Pseudomonas syringae group]MBX8498348.1 hypothetical protein [Pseudomonas lijiangensis]MBX8503255.1 hypothetical protein [Pseudomonas lijiangensis]MBX8534508.1 hypothetical protein [Pseudomonas cichorii]QWU81141.1 hypothetical protein KQP88_13770 [Pseudomonas lijiangensis]